MSVSASDDFEATSRCGSLDANSEWRSIEQVENGTPSTSPPYYDSDDDDDGPKPSELYGRHTWKIEKFQTIKKRELRGDVFDVGGYKWYILIYPQGCDVCNHLSLFLCVANHDKLLPGWSHLAQFSIAVVNKDPKKSKYSDTLHRFWKKEHDWGWKKFMELSKVKDGFIDDDENLIIKAQVQVIRERTNGPFWCLDLHYRRELVRVYLSNVEQVCRHFVEERKNKLSNLVLDKNKWPSFRAFWAGIDRISSRRITRDRTDSILKLLVKHFFIEKEVTSTLVMDALYTGLKVLEWQSRGDNVRLALRLPALDDVPEPLVRIDEDMFVLADDIINLIERAASEPALRQKEEKTAQSGKKDGASGEDGHKDSIEYDERRLTELGRRTMEIFVLGHIFSRIEIAYQEAVALKRQEELIREEELFGSSSDLRGKNGGINKEKRSSKKKQMKQKRNSRKENKGKAKDFTLDGKLVDLSNESDSINNKPEDASDLSDSADLKTEPSQPDLNETNEPEEAMLPSVDVKIQEFTPSGGNRRRLSKSGSRRNKEGSNQFTGASAGAGTGASSPPPDVPTHSGRYYSGSYRGPRSESENLVVSLKDRIKLLQQRLVEVKVEDSLLKKFNAKELGEVFSKTEGGTESASPSASASSSSSPMKNPNKLSSKPSVNLPSQENSKQICEKNTSPAVKPSEPIISTTKDPATVTSNPVPTNRAQANRPISSSSSSKTENQKQKQKQVTREKCANAATSASSANTTLSSPVTAKVTLQQKPAPQPVFSMAPSAPVSTHAPQSYRNAITGSNTPVMPSQPSAVVPPEHGLRFGTVTIETLNGDTQFESSCQESSISSSVEGPELYEPQNNSSEEDVPEMEPPSLGSHQQSGLGPDEFPHLDIINELLDEDQSNGYNHSFFSRQYSLPDRSGMATDVSSSWTPQPEAYYESFPRVYGSFGTPRVNVSAYSDSQIEVLRNHYAYLRTNNFSVLPGVNVGDVNGYSMYGNHVGEYSTNVTNGGVSNGYTQYYHGMSPNGNLGSLQS
ncbi:MATH domain-containing protein [Rhynchospora pubera]|uniref:MATH domain-containing protein n=1 Tax=Rhynchospora pubera TaxID=906938 RepID=A0AAV8BT75_9POAL|nr:MATH domain-containing protein [Rhynchospora pubera]